MTASGHFLLLPRCKTRDRFTPENRHCTAYRSTHIGQTQTTSYILAYIDAFWDYAVFAMIMIAIALLLRRLEHSQMAAAH